MALRKYFFISLFLLFGFLLLEVSVQKKMLLVLNPPPQKPLQMEQTQELISKFTEGSSWAESLVQVLNNSGSVTEDELTFFAKELVDRKDFNFLKETLKNESLDLQKKSLIIEILSQNGSEESLKILKDYSLSQKSTMSDEDVIAKTQAIDGISTSNNKSLATEILNEISIKSDSSFLTDRALRAKSNIVEETQKTE